MTVSVLYFGVLKDRFGRAGEQVELVEGASVRLLLEGLPEAGSTFWKSLAVAVNQEYAGLDTVLHEGDEVALLPPVSGGTR